MPRKRWHIDACDINPRHLERARAGRYSELSFRQFGPALRAKYFRPADGGGGWQLDESIRETVNFRQSNLVDPQPLPRSKPYDLIFCRNLLIYLHDAARQQVIDSLERLLAPEGLVSTGHAEPLQRTRRPFLSGRAGSMFCFSRGTQSTRARTHRKPRRPRNGKGDRLQRQRRRRPRETSGPRAASPRPKKAQASVTVASTSAADDLLSVARMHADAGRLEEAWAACQSQLTAAGPSAELFTLMGIVEQARQNQVAAKQCFEKALYPRSAARRFAFASDAAMRTTRSPRPGEPATWTARACRPAR